MYDIALQKDIVNKLAQGIEPKFSDYEGVTQEKFGVNVESLESKYYIEGSEVIRSGQGDTVKITWLNTAKATEEGIKWANN